VGKKQTCPYCKEKVDLKKMFCNPYPLFRYAFLFFIKWFKERQKRYLDNVDCRNVQRYIKTHFIVYAWATFTDNTKLFHLLVLNIKLIV